MKPYELYNHIWNTEYNKSGFDLDWKVEVDNLEKKIRLLFQPSMSYKDWIVNICFLPIFKFPAFYCFGWKKAYDRCSDRILFEVICNCLDYHDYDVEITGHSYGGTMSIIAAIDLFMQFGIRADVITFGSPKTLFLFVSKLVAKGVIKDIKQYSHRSDIVTYMPPFLGYHHVKKIKLGKFHFKWLFKPTIYHMSYGDESLYNEV